MQGSSGNPSGSSRDTGDRFYIDKKNCFFWIFLYFSYFSLLSLHIPSFGTITGSRDPSRIVDLAERFILVYSLSLLAHWDACSGPDKAICALATQHMCSCNPPYVLLQHTICSFATHHMFSCNTPSVLLQHTIRSLGWHHMDPWNPRQVLFCGYWLKRNRPGDFFVTFSRGG